jgi:hypothetical protein
MAIPFRSYVSKILLLFALVIYLAPELSEQVRSLGASFFTIAAAIWNWIFGPKPDPADRMPRIIWDERDGGEKFSIIMFHLMLLIGGLTLAFAIARTANSPDGIWWMVFPAAVIAASTTWLIWSNWKNRNAR